MKKIVVLLILCILSFPFFATDVLQCNSDTMSLVVESDVDAEPICQQQEREEKARQERERQEQKKREEEAKKAKAAAAAMGLLGSGNQIAANPQEVTAKGRTCLKLVKPSGKFTEVGKVVLRITVDEEGNVFPRVSAGTTISDEQVIQAAMVAAMATKFSRGEIETGTITYIFK